MLGGIAAAVLLAAAPFGLTASPAHLAAQPGQVRSVSVTNTGTAPATVAVSLDQVRSTAGHCGVARRATPGITVSPASITLQPGKSGRARVTIAPGTPPSDVAVVFSSAAGHRGNIAVTGAVAAQVTVSGPEASARPCVSAAKAASASGPSGLDTGLGGGLVLLMLAAAGVMLARRERRGGAHRS